MKLPMLQEKIISLLRSSPELCDFLLASPEKLQTADYANIIAGAPISLWAKQELLGELEASLTDSGDTEFVHRYVTCLDAALQSMTRPAGETLIAAEFCGADNVGEYTDGPYYTHSRDAFAEILRTARAEDEDDWQIQYWRIKQYACKIAPLHCLREKVACIHNFRFCFKGAHYHPEKWESGKNSRYNEHYPFDDSIYPVSDCYFFNHDILLIMYPFL